MIDYKVFTSPGGFKKVFAEAVEEDSLEQLKYSLVGAEYLLNMVEKDLNRELIKGTAHPATVKAYQTYQWMREKLIFRINELETGSASSTGSSPKDAKSKRQHQASKRRRKNK